MILKDVNCVQSLLYKVALLNDNITKINVHKTKIKCKFNFNKTMCF
jgi:hypothetical protein